MMVGNDKKEDAEKVEECSEGALLLDFKHSCAPYNVLIDQLNFVTGFLSEIRSRLLSHQHGLLHPVIAPLLRSDLLREDDRHQASHVETPRRPSTTTLCSETLSSPNQTSPDGPK